jgi:hypothetical protein
VLLEVVALVSDQAEVAMLGEHLVGRVRGTPVTVLVRPGVRLPPWDQGAVHAVPVGAGGVVERVLKDYAAHARGHWLLQVDPDEVWPDEAFRRAEELAGRLDRSEAAAFPMTYHVGARPLRAGPWSGIHQQRLNSAWSHARAAGEVHVPPPATRVERVRLAAAVQHLWVPDLAALRAKADRYLGTEGSARLARFGPYQPPKAAVQLARSVAGCVGSAPWRDGPLGLRLAAEMVRYQWKANAAWRRESRRRATAPRRPPPSPPPRRAPPRRGRR